MQTGFENRQVLTLWRAGLPDLLPVGMNFFWRGHQFRHKPGGYSDGLSSPQYLHGLSAGNPRGWAYQPAVAHDGGYHGALEILASVSVQGKVELPVWKPFPTNKEESDLMFRELCAAVARDEAERAQGEIYFHMVKEFGQSAWDAGHAAR